MTLSATYDEISRLLREKSGQQIGFRYKDADTLTVLPWRPDSGRVCVRGEVLRG